MYNTIVLITYCVLLAVFLLMAILAIRHTMRFGYISQKFKAIAWIFGIVALGVIIFSVYLLINLYKPTTSNLFPKTSKTDINY
jgi:hypothetical protein